MAGRPADLKLNTAIAEKELVLAKKPKGHPETVAVLAFALAEAGKAEFTEEDIRRAYIRADVKPPKVVGQAIRDSKNQCDFIEPGSKRGTYKLSNHGDRTVRFDLPKSSRLWTICPLNGDPVAQSGISREISRPKRPEESKARRFPPITKTYISLCDQHQFLFSNCSIQLRSARTSGVTYIIAYMPALW